MRLSPIRTGHKTSQDKKVNLKPHQKASPACGLAVCHLSSSHRSADRKSGGGGGPLQKLHHWGHTTIFHTAEEMSEFSRAANGDHK